MYKELKELATKHNIIIVTATQPHVSRPWYQQEVFKDPNIHDMIILDYIETIKSGN